jgi:hypothetical protein
VSIKGIGLLTVDGFFTKNTKQMSIWISASCFLLRTVYPSGQ